MPAARQAVANVLKRKRSEHLALSLKMSLFLEKREAPPKGMGAELEALAGQIRTLEDVINALATDE